MKASASNKTIEVRIKNAQQLFDFRDPSPFHERDLDDDFVEYVTSSANEISRRHPLNLTIYIGESLDPQLNAETIVKSIHGFFQYRSEITKVKLKRLLRRAQFFLLMGMVVLVACITLSKALTSALDGQITTVLREGIIIFGWVSLWKPIELLMFDWWPIFEEIRLYRRLVGAVIDIRTEKS